tara:strand:+ start:26 stop:202 length:177 start_codon:yes stop_codon:yes gene_type:complete
MVNVDHIVDSYEIYGEDKTEEESEEDYTDNKQKRNGSYQRTSASRRNNSRPHHDGFQM